VFELLAELRWVDLAEQLGEPLVEHVPPSLQILHLPALGGHQAKV
jgi:hypothetical protein